MEWNVVVSLCASAFWLGAGFLILFILIMRRQLIHYGIVLVLSFVLMFYTGFTGFMYIMEKTAPAVWLFFTTSVVEYFKTAILLILFALYSTIITIVDNKLFTESAPKLKIRVNLSALFFVTGIVLLVASGYSLFISKYVLHGYISLIYIYLIIKTFRTKDKTSEYWLVIILTCFFAMLEIFFVVLFISGQVIPTMIKIFQVVVINAQAAALIFLMFVELQVHSPEITALDSCIENLTHTTQNYISPFLLKELDVSNINDLKIGDRVQKDLTILFSDLRSFTELSEQLSPEQNFAFINSYLSRMVPIISQNSGFVDKYLGDGIMAVFPDAKGADNALKSAVVMQEKIQEYNRHRANSGYKPVSLGVGINTGSSIMGVIGTHERYEATVISDAVNLASRLQSISKAFNIGIVISESTFLQLTSLVEYRYRFIGKVRVKGKNIPISVFEIFNGQLDEIVEKKLKVNTIFEQGMIAYYQKAYTHAVTLFRQALEILPDDGAAKFYLQASLQKILLKKQHI